MDVVVSSLAITSGPHTSLLCLISPHFSASVWTQSHHLVSLHAHANIHASAVSLASELFCPITLLMPSCSFACVQIFCWNRVTLTYGMAEIFYFLQTSLSCVTGPTRKLLGHSGPFHTFSGVWWVKATMSLEKVKWGPLNPSDLRFEVSLWREEALVTDNLPAGAWGGQAVVLRVILSLVLSIFSPHPVAILLFPYDSRSCKVDRV